MSYNNLVLVVDDEKDIVQAYVDFLSFDQQAAPQKKSSRSGSTTEKVEEPITDSYEILKAYNGEEAVALVKKEFEKGRRIAGGFFDVKMPGKLDGIQAIQEIWKIDPEVHCTIVTAYHDRSVQDIHKLFGQKFKDQWDYLNKPFTHGEILQKARQMTASWNRIMDLKDTQMQLISSERMAAIGQVSRGIAHEFNNILQRIVGKADLAMSMTDPKQVKESLEVILQASERAAYIIRNLQSFSKTPSEKRPVEPKRVFMGVLSLLGHELKIGSIEIVDKCTPSGSFQANEVEIQQVIMNLIINASHAMPEGGKLEIGCSEEAGKIKIWVADSGTGIPTDVLPRIFEYGFTTKGDKGSGLGLAICKKIVEAHQGTIQVQSELKKGTKFVLTFTKL